MISILQHTGLVLLYIVVFLVSLLIFAGVPGGWIGLAAIFVYDLAGGFSVIGWQWWIVMAGMLALGEVVEALLGSVVAVRKGASKWGAFGALAGGIIGAVAGAAVIPVAGGLIFALAGAFAGAVAAEYIQYRRMGDAINIGFWAFIGKLSAFFIKYALAMGMLVIFIIRSWP